MLDLLEVRFRFMGGWESLPFFSFFTEPVFKYWFMPSFRFRVVGLTAALALTLAVTSSGLSSAKDPVSTSLLPERRRFPPLLDLGAATSVGVLVLASLRLPDLWGTTLPFTPSLLFSSVAGGRSAASFVPSFCRLLVLLFLDEAAVLSRRDDLLVLTLRLMADVDFWAC